MSNAEKLKDRMRKKQSQLPAPPAPEPPTTVTHSCGHVATFREIPKDKFRNERYVKDNKRACPPCREANKKAEAEALAKKKAARKYNDVPLDLGVGYTFGLVHVAVGKWEYWLRHTESDLLVCKGEASSLRKCMADMNKPLMDMRMADAGGADLPS